MRLAMTSMGQGLFKGRPKTENVRKTNERGVRWALSSFEESKARAVVTTVHLDSTWVRFAVIRVKSEQC